MATRVAEIATGVPALTPERNVTWPKRTKARLANGLEVVLAESHSIPRFHGELFFRSGNAAVAHRAPSLADMTATVVRTGTTKRASRQIEEDLRSLGADLGSSAGADNSAISFAGLSEFSEPLLALAAANVLADPPAPAGPLLRRSGRRCSPASNRVRARAVPG